LRKLGVRKVRPAAREFGAQGFSLRKHRPETTENVANIARAILAGQGNTLISSPQVTSHSWSISAACLHIPAKELMQQAAFGRFIGDEFSR
jgi:hypothetical protein